MSVYLMVSLQGSVFQEREQKENRSSNRQTSRERAGTHSWWSVGKRGKDNLNNIRLFIAILIMVRHTVSGFREQGTKSLNERTS
jgi:hypothetical protein